MNNILQLAFAELGTTEIKGSEHNLRIVDYAHESGFSYINDDETPWCSIFINWICTKLILKKTNKLDARSWLEIGKAIEDPKPGDIVIFWRGDRDGWKGHVAIFLGYSANGNIYCIGGNQKNSVSIAEYDVKKVLGFRRLAESDSLAIPKATLKFGDENDEVVKLQDLLNSLNYKCGDADGFFGKKTHIALTLFQQAQGLSYDGIYSPECENYITSKNQE